MQFESRHKRSLVIAALLGLILDSLIATVISAVLGGGVIGFVVAFFGLQVPYFLIWLKTALWNWLVFSLAGPKAEN